MVQTLRKVAVIGGGAKGSQIAAVCALAGFDVNVRDSHKKTFEKNMGEISQRLQFEVGKGKTKWKKLDDVQGAHTSDKTAEMAMVLREG